MKSKYIFLAALLPAFIGLSGCSSDEEVAESSPKEIKLSAKNTLMQTRTIRYDDYGLQGFFFDEGAAIDIFINEDATTPSKTFTQPLVYTVSSDNKTLTTSAAQYYGINNVFIYGVYPSGVATDVNNTATAFSVQTNQTDSTAYLNSDLMVGYPVSDTTTGPISVSPTTESVNLQFNHLLSKVIFIVHSETVDLNGATLTLKNVKTSTTFSPKSTTVGEATGDAQDILVGTLDENYALEWEYALTCIAVPQSIASGTVLVEIKLSDAAGGATLSYTTTDNDNVTLSPGCYHYFNISAEMTGINLSATVTDWNEGTYYDFTAH